MSRISDLREYHKKLSKKYFDLLMKHKDATFDESDRKEMSYICKEMVDTEDEIMELAKEQWRERKKGRSKNV